MTATPVDILMVFVGTSLLVAGVACAAMRFKFDAVAWALLSAASAPSAVYFAVRAGLGATRVAETVAGVALGWAMFLVLLWTRARVSRFGQDLAAARTRELEAAKPRLFDLGGE